MIKMRSRCPQCKRKEWTFFLKKREINVPKVGVVTSNLKMCRRCNRAAKKIKI